MRGCLTRPDAISWSLTYACLSSCLCHNDSLFLARPTFPCRYWCNKPIPETASLAAAIHPAANAFHLSDTGLYVVHNTQLPPAGQRTVSPGSQGRRGRRNSNTDIGLSAVTSAHTDAAAAGLPMDAAGNAPGPLLGVTRASSEAVAAAASAAAAAAADGIPVMTADSHGPSGPAGRVPASCEADIFRAVGLAYVPPHLRSWH